MNQEIKSDAEIVSAAVVRASDLMGINLKELSELLFVSYAELSQLLKSGIEPISEAGKRSISLINIYKNLATKCGNNKKYMAHFLNTENKYFEAKPIDIMKTHSGLEKVHHYLVAMGSKH